MSISKHNAEGYADPTVYAALTNIERERRGNSRFRPIVYICSPLAGDVAGNQARARRYCRFAVASGCIPLAPHLLFPQFMDEGDKVERDLALAMDLALLSKCAQVWVFGSTISSGMRAEIAKAKRKGKPIRYFDTACREVGR